MPSYSWSTSTSPGVPGTAVAGKRVLFLGKGLLSPLREDSVTGDFQRVSDEDNVRQCLRDGILTALGERVMQEGLGTIAPDLLFEQSEIISDLLGPSVRDFVNRFEPRVSLQAVNVKVGDQSASLLEVRISIVYVILATNTRDNLVFPFFLAPDSLAGVGP